MWWLALAPQRLVFPGQAGKQPALPASQGLVLVQ
jgi:hypothetical protein